MHTTYRFWFVYIFSDNICIYFKKTPHLIIILYKSKYSIDSIVKGFTFKVKITFITNLLTKQDIRIKIVKKLDWRIDEKKVRDLGTVDAMKLIVYSQKRKKERRK